MWWSAAGRAIKSVIRKARIGSSQISAIGLSGQMHGSVFLGRGSRPLRPAILWNDQRTIGQCDQIEKVAGGRRKLINMVGNPALTGFTAPKILWVAQHEPRVYEKTQHLLLPKDYIRYCMTGEYATDVGDASGTLLFDVKKRRWNKKLISRLQIDSSWLPACYESQDVTGYLHQRAASALGLVKGIPVVGGSGDQPAGAIGNGIVSSGIASATLGTSGVVYAHASKPVYDSQGRVHTMCAAVKDKWCVFGCMLSAGGSFQWLRNQLGQKEQEQANRHGVDPYELLIRQAQQVGPGCEGLFFLPYLTGERCPYPDANARGAWIGLTVRHTRAAMIRSLLEGVTYGMCDALRIIEAMGLNVRTIRLSGGGARSRFWRQLQCDIYSKPVAMVAAEEGPAYGAAILAGVGIGWWRSVPQACRAVVKQVETLTPDRVKGRDYARRHRQYQRFYMSLKQEFENLGSLA